MVGRVDFVLRECGGSCGSVRGRLGAGWLGKVWVVEVYCGVSVKLLAASCAVWRKMLWRGTLPRLGCWGWIVWVWEDVGWYGGWGMGQGGCAGGYCQS